MALDPLTAGLEAGGKFFDGLFGIFRKFIPDADKAMEATREAAALVHVEVMGQIQINTEEAKHASIFVAGWRPFIGWVCGSSLAIYYIPRMIIIDAMWIWACVKAGTLVPFPEMPIGDLLTLLGGMLGLGALRTIDKVMGGTSK